jgi:hypothetical protein
MRLLPYIHRIQRLDFIHHFDKEYRGHVNNGYMQLFIQLIILVNSIFSTTLKHATSSTDLHGFIFFDMSPYHKHSFHDKYSNGRYSSVEIEQIWISFQKLLCSGDVLMILQHIVQFYSHTNYAPFINNSPKELGLKIWTMACIIIMPNWGLL